MPLQRKIAITRDGEAGLCVSKYGMQGPYVKPLLVGW